METIEHHYPLDTGYLTYMTKGYTRTCSFCAVPKLEPIYKEKISIKEQIARIKREHGERKDLILMDNNVLGSPRFPEIIDEIIDLGFHKGAKYVEPNRLERLTDYLLTSIGFVGYPITSFSIIEISQPSYGKDSKST